MVQKVLTSMFLGLILLPICGQAQITAIKAGRVIDPDTGKTDSNQIILVEQGKISAIWLRP